MQSSLNVSYHYYYLLADTMVHEAAETVGAVLEG